MARSILPIEPASGEAASCTKRAGMSSQQAGLRHSVMPVADSFIGGFVRMDRGQLRKTDSHIPALPSD
jgi:hypothetical protein